MDNEVEIHATMIDDIDTSGPKATINEFAQDTKQRLTKAGQESGDGFARGLDGRLRDSRGRFAKAGTDLGEETNKGFGTRIFASLTSSGLRAGVMFSKSFVTSTPMMGVGIAAGLQAGVAIAPAIGGLMGFGLVAGLAASISAKKPEVQTAFSGMTEGIKKDLESISGPMDRVLINFARNMRALSAENKGELGEMFATAADQADRLVSSVRPLVKNLLPGIKDALAGAEPTIDVLADEIPELGTAISGFLSDLSEGGEMGARSMQMLMDAVQNSLGIMGESIKLGNQWMEAVPPGILLLSELGGEQRNAAEAAREHATAAEELAKEQERQTAATEAAIDAAAKQARATLTASNAHIALLDAISEATEAAKKNGRTLDLNTAAGRRNMSALNGIAAAALRKVEADRKAGASAQHVSNVTEAGRSSFVRMALAMGASMRQAYDLAAALFGIPNITRTVRVRYIGSQEALDSARRGGRAGGGEQRHAHGGIAGAAAGGARSGLHLVGEHGPEFVNLAPGSQVHSNPDTKRMAAMMGGGGVADVILSWEGADSALMNAIIAGLRYRVNSQAGGSAERFFKRAG